MSYNWKVYLYNFTIFIQLNIKTRMPADPQHKLLHLHRSNTDLQQFNIPTFVTWGFVV